MARKQRWLQRKLKLSHHRHTGKMIHHRHTSSGVLFAIFILVGSLIIYGNSVVAAASQTMDGAVTLGGVMPSTADNTPTQPSQSIVAGPVINPCTKNCTTMKKFPLLKGDYGVAEVVLWSLFGWTFILYLIHWLAVRSGHGILKIFLWKTWHHSR